MKKDIKSQVFVYTILVVVIVICVMLLLPYLNKGVSLEPTDTSAFNTESEEASTEISVEQEDNGFVFNEIAKDYINNDFLLLRVKGGSLTFKYNNAVYSLDFSRNLINNVDELTFVPYAHKDDYTYICVNSKDVKNKDLVLVTDTVWLIDGNKLKEDNANYSDYENYVIDKITSDTWNVSFNGETLKSVSDKDIANIEASNTGTGYITIKSESEANSSDKIVLVRNINDLETWCKQPIAQLLEKSADESDFNDKCYLFIRESANNKSDIVVTNIEYNKARTKAKISMVKTSPDDGEKVTDLAFITVIALDSTIEDYEIIEN